MRGRRSPRSAAARARASCRGSRTSAAATGGAAPAACRPGRGASGPRRACAASGWARGAPVLPSGLEPPPAGPAPACSPALPASGPSAPDVDSPPPGGRGACSASPSAASMWLRGLRASQRAHKACAASRVIQPAATAAWRSAQPTVTAGTLRAGTAAARAAGDAASRGCAACAAPPAPPGTPAGASDAASARAGAGPAPAAPGSARDRVSVVAESADVALGCGLRPGQDTGLTTRPAVASCARGDAAVASLGRASCRAAGLLPAARAGSPRRSSSVRRPDRRRPGEEESGRSNAPSSAKLGKLPGRRGGVLDRGAAALRPSAGAAPGSCEPGGMALWESLIETGHPSGRYAAQALIGRPCDHFVTATTTRRWRSGAEKPYSTATRYSGPCEGTVGGQTVAMYRWRSTACARRTKPGRRP